MMVNEPAELGLAIVGIEPCAQDKFMPRIVDDAAWRQPFPAQGYQMQKTEHLLKNDRYPIARQVRRFSYFGVQYDVPA
jgi:hypothetical protein